MANARAGACEEHIEHAVLAKVSLQSAGRDRMHIQISSGRQGLRRAKGELHGPGLLRSGERPFPGQRAPRTVQEHSVCVGAFSGHAPWDQTTQTS